MTPKLPSTPGIIKNDQLSDLVVAPDFAVKIAIDLSASVEARWESARQHEELGKARFAAMGLLLLSIRKEMPHGEFLPELERRGFEERQAQRAMAYANYVFSQPLQQQTRLLEMPVSKVATLAQADPEVVEVLMEDGDKVERTTVRGLLDAIKEKEALIARKDKAYADLEAQLDGKNLELRKLSRVDPAALLSRSVRAEALADAAALGECCDNLTRLWDAACEEQNDAERDLRQRAVALSVSASIVHVQALYERVKADLQTVGLDLPLALGVADDFTRDERAEAAACLDRLRLQFLVRKEKRAEEAYAEHVGDGGAKKRGRKAKSKTGAGDGQER